MNKNNTLFVGVDLGDKYSHLTTIDQDGQLVEESRLQSTKQAFERKFSNTDRCRIAMEVGSNSRWASHLLNELGHNVLVANARKLRAIYDNPRKGGQADAETLARLARLDPKLLSPIHHSSPQAQADLAVIRSRDVLVRSRTKLINHVRGMVKASGDRIPSCSAASFSTKVAGSILDSMQSSLLPILEIIDSVTREIREYDRKIEQLCEERYPETRHLQ